MAQGVVDRAALRALIADVAYAPRVMDEVAPQVVDMLVDDVLALLPRPGK